MGRGGGRWCGRAQPAAPHSEATRRLTPARLPCAEPEARGWEDRLPRLQRFLVEAQHSLERRRHNILVTAACLCSGQPPLRAPWLPDRAALACCHCSTPFAPYIRRHHCRACGGLFWCV